MSLIPFSIVVEVPSQRQIPYVTDRLLNSWHLGFRIRNAHPAVDDKFKGTEIPYSLRIELDFGNSLENVRRDLMKMGWNQFKVTQAYPIPDMDPQLAEAIERAADDHGDLPS